MLVVPSQATALIESTDLMTAALHLVEEVGSRQILPDFLTFQKK
jgi:hypothetical protein